MDKIQVLQEIFANDPLGILEVKAKLVALNTDERLVSSFEELNSFYEQHKRLPEKTNGLERTLCSRLEAINANPKKIEALRQYDRYNLLQDTRPDIEINSIDDIFATDELWIFDDIDEKKDIFKLSNLPIIKSNRADPDFIAQRVIYKEFKQYEDLFVVCQEDLKSNRRKLIPSIESQLSIWTFCILDWVLLYIAAIGKEKRWNSWKINRRTLLIFENWTKSNMLLRSLWKSLKLNWKMVTKLLDKEDTFFQNIVEEDQKNWYIYILKSLSNDDRIATKRNLHKIWFSTTSVEERIKGAENDPTYLMAKVQIIETFQCYNVNPNKLEQLLHKFFWKSCLNIEIIDQKWNRYIPRERFIAPVYVIAEVIELIINWEIVKYRYDEENERIVEK